MIRTAARWALKRRDPQHFRLPSKLFSDVPKDGKAAVALGANISEASTMSPGVRAWYLDALEKRPILTKSLTAAGIFAAADATAQGITNQPSTLGGTEGKLSVPKYDVLRTLRMAGIGLFLSGPTLHLWFAFMARILPSRDLTSSVKKLLLGQALYGPVFTTTFFSVNAALQGESRAEILARLRRDLIPTFASGLVYWPLCDLFMFSRVPVHLQNSPSLSATSAASWSSISLGEDFMPALGATETQPLPGVLSSGMFGLSSARTPALASRLLQQRNYVQLRTILDVADNSGARSVMCIKVLKGARRNAAAMGDIIIASVKEATPGGKVKKGEVVTCVVVRAAMPSWRGDGSAIRFDKTSAVVINKAGEPIGTRVFGPVPNELRRKKMVKILALAQQVM